MIEEQIGNVERGRDLGRRRRRPLEACVHLYEVNAAFVYEYVDPEDAQVALVEQPAAHGSSHLVDLSEHVLAERVDCREVVAGGLRSDGPRMTRSR